MWVRIPLLKSRIAQSGGSFVPEAFSLGGQAGTEPCTIAVTIRLHTRETHAVWGQTWGHGSVSNRKCRGYLPTVLPPRFPRVPAPLNHSGEMAPTFREPSVPTHSPPSSRETARAIWFCSATFAF